MVSIVLPSGVEFIFGIGKLSVALSTPVERHGNPDLWWLKERFLRFSGCKSTKGSKVSRDFS
jgi:hypothetical protein